MTRGRRSSGSGLASRRQRGNFLLEALIGVLIVAFGLLGLIGLQAKTMQNATDAQFRSEAIFLASSFIAQMWVSDPTLLQANFSSAAAGPNYTEFKNYVAARLPCAVGPCVQTVTVTPPAGNVTGTLVTVTMQWQPPGDELGLQIHQYVTTAIVGAN